MHAHQSGRHHPLTGFVEVIAHHANGAVVYGAVAIGDDLSREQCAGKAKGKA
jgi:hypothetical protein